MTDQDMTLPLDRAVDWYLDGKPITYRDCIRNQCGPVALSYAERIQELALAHQADPLEALWLSRLAVESALQNSQQRETVPYAYRQRQADTDIEVRVAPHKA